MIYDAVKNAGHYAGLGERFQKAFDYLNATDLSQLPVGRHEIDGEDIAIIIQDAVLKPWDEGRWEAHRRYADIQIVIHGRECIGFCLSDGAKVETPYAPEKDVMFYEDMPGNAGIVNAGEMMILFPQDAHRPCIQTDEGPATVRKAVLKVRL